MCASVRKAFISEHIFAGVVRVPAETNSTALGSRSRASPQAFGAPSAAPTFWQRCAI